MEADATPVQELSEIWFRNFATDLRYTSTEFLPVYPTNSLTNAKQIEFNIGGFTGAGCLNLQDAMLFLKVKLTKEDGSTTVPTGKMVAPVNATLHSLFSSVSTRLNDQVVNNSNDMYNYKAYLLTHLSYGATPKYSFLQGAGVYEDTPGNLDNPESNAGFTTRSARFKKGILPTDAYHGEEVQYAAKLYLDLVTTDTPIPPGVAVRIILTLSGNDFVLQVPQSESDKYKLIITEAVLHVPVAIMGPEVFSKFEKRLAEKSASIYFRRIEMMSKSIPKGTTVYNSETLFSLQANPCKIIVGLVDTAAFVGDFKKNPFNFKRLWKKDQNTSFVQSMTMTLNAKTLDGLDGKASERDDMLKFLRFHHFLQADNNESANNISYLAFMEGSFLGVWDCSTSGHCGMDFLTPAIRMGALRLSIEFSKPSLEEITVIFFSEFPSVIKINKARQISLSYYK